MGLSTSERVKERRRLLLQLRRAEVSLIEVGRGLYRYSEVGCVKRVARAAVDAGWVRRRLLSGSTRLG